MNLIVCKDYDEMSKKAAELASACISPKEERLVSFPGGDTPLGMITAFVGMVNAGKVDVSQTRFVQLDEWVGLGEEDQGSCVRFNKINLFNKLKRPFLDRHVINGLAADIKAECSDLNAYVEKFGPLALSVLGIGLNGHIGFNEDGVDFKKDAHIIPLSDTTRQVMRKYFDREHKLDFGITLGITQLMAAKKVILLANGSHKAAILKKAFEGPIINAVPASILQRHPDCTVVADVGAAKELR